LDAFLLSTALVALAEMGDKTQLLAFVLAARLRRRGAIVLGILVATLANHLLAGAVGTWLAHLVAVDILRWIVAGAFIVFGLWALVPDTLEERTYSRGSAFLTTLVAFFFVEMGDKTQLATVALAARFDALAPVVAGTTLGMMLANVPAVWLGEALAQRVDLRVMRWIAAALFVASGVATLVFT
jgi:putative Ca2+/H+ antiporter (TMEM165/GDT1 family)